MAIHGVVIELAPTAASLELVGRDGVAALAEAFPDLSVGTIDLGARTTDAGPVAFRLVPEQLGIERGDPRLLAVAAAAASCHLRELVVVGEATSPLAGSTAATGARWVPVPGSVASLSGDDLVALVAGARTADAAATGLVGVGPHPPPWPPDPHLDPALLEHGDRRNVIDRYRYWREVAIVADLDAHRLPVHVAVENWRHDLNIGTVVRNANAFNVAGVHIIGKRRWNRRGAMATDRYLTVHHHETAAAFAAWAAAESLPIIGIDNIQGSVPIESADLPSPCVLAFGQEGPGLSDELVEACSTVCGITQRGSTRSLNAGVASGIALYAWASAHGPAWLGRGPVP